MDSLITAPARALAAGDPLGALKRVALRDDPPAPPLPGIAMGHRRGRGRARCGGGRATEADPPSPRPPGGRGRGAAGPPPPGWGGSGRAGDRPLPWGGGAAIWGGAPVWWSRFRHIVRDAGMVV